ncbi:FAD-dependent oxidoreductase [Streptomyces sp. PSKA30]|uniref:NAD(P)/FAD-dependent oxidoreductase n=1 Tax=Streptomyces sp. PSKA30 TaxID=2874597 RepID=UPI001CD12FA5|nr:FAD-dependent oxidoreductase [Streptomyces sp. PSKA30]MBZ9645764.1 FAD-dependent oxidoreductase [Streptomyces sp. PSKA30]
MSRDVYDTDLLIVGAGPAGLAAALYAARAGMSVTVCEKRPDPVDKACGEGLMPGGVRRLHALGVCPAGAPLTGIDYLDLSGRRAHAPFRAGPGMGVRRTELQAALSAAAHAVGAHRLDARVTAAAQDATGVNAAGLRARWLIAADGLHSPLRRHLGVPVRRGFPRRFGLRRHWHTEPWSQSVQVVWGPHAEAYITPVAADQVGVAVLYRPDATPSGAAAHHAYAGLLEAFPHLHHRLAHAAPASSVRGAGPMRQQPARRVVGRILLVGDAAGYEDALTGEGISLALAQAEAAVDALVADTPARYGHAWRRLTRRYRWLTHTLVLATTHPGARSLLVPACLAAPTVFRAAVNQLADP